MSYDQAESQMPKMPRPAKTRAVAETIVVLLCKYDPEKVDRWLKEYYESRREDGRPAYPIGEIDGLRQACRQVYRDRIRTAT